MRSSRRPQAGRCVRCVGCQGGCPKSCPPPPPTLYPMVLSHSDTSLTQAVTEEAGTWRQRDSGCARAGRPGDGGGGGYLPPFQCIQCSRVHRSPYPLNPLPPQAAVPLGLSPPRAPPLPLCLAYPHPHTHPLSLSLRRLCQRSPRDCPCSTALCRVRTAEGTGPRRWPGASKWTPPSRRRWGGGNKAKSAACYLRVGSLRYCGSDTRTHGLCPDSGGA